MTRCRLSCTWVKIRCKLSLQVGQFWLQINTYRTIHKAWQRLRREAGLPNLRIHDLRHSAASYMAQAGVSLYVIQQVLSHSDPSVTQRYAHLSIKTLQDAADKTSDVIQAALKESA